MYIYTFLFQIQDLLHIAGFRGVVFDFMKCSNKALVSPVVAASHKWNGRNVHGLSGQGAVYIKIHVSVHRLFDTMFKKLIQAQHFT